MDTITIYFAGEIHNPRRDQLRKLIEERDLPVRFVGPKEEHDRFGSVGKDILGQQPSARYRNLMGAGVKLLGTRMLLRRAHMAAFFGGQYKQWNAAGDAGAAVAARIPLLLVRSPDLLQTSRATPGHSAARAARR